MAINLRATQYTVYFLFALILVAFIYNHNINSNLTSAIADLQNMLRKVEQQSENQYLHKKSPPLMPSIPTTEEEEKSIKRGIYGGKGDKPHLGGFIEKDWKGISPALWDFMLGPLAVKSFIDVGCGRGYSSKYFLDRGARVVCVEGSHDAVTKSLLPLDIIREHDFSRGPWWPEQTFDVAWSIEFVEHVGRQYMPNYFPIFKKSAIIMVSNSIWGGHHHVEVHNGDWWWHGRFLAAGFVHLPELEKMTKAIIEANLTHPGDNEYLAEPHRGINLGSMHIFINPSVASLPQHHHLFGGNGCFKTTLNNADGGKPCEGVDKLPEAYQSLLDCYRHQTDGDVDKVEALYLTCSKHKIT